jgi:hypothetical protein
LALLAALASYQVDEHVITGFRQHFPSDEQLISTAAWASYTATRKVASWLGVSQIQPARQTDSVAVSCG